MSSLAHAQPSSQLAQRVAIAAQGHEHMSFVIDNVIAAVRRWIAAIGPRLERWSEAHHRAVQDRIFWELALSDRVLMEEIRAARGRAIDTARE